MTNITVAKEVVCLCREAEISLFLWGTHGLGKSSLVRQVADELGIEFIDLRCAQMEAVDLRGFPAKGDDGRTHFLPPAELPAGGEGILFLDELNRAGDDIVAALFQLVLDRRVGEYQLPEGWSIVAAGNFGDSDYNVNELDPAFLDRFCHVVVSSGDSTIDEWSSWMMKEHGDIAYNVVNFCTVSGRNLESPSEDNLSFEIKPSRRSWDAAVRGLTAIQDKEFSQSAVQQFLIGLVGLDVAISFLNHTPTVLPKDILRAGMQRMKRRLQQCKRHELSAIIAGLIESLPAALENSDMKINLFDFIDFLSAEHPDLAIAFCTSALATDPEFKELETKSALLSNVRLSKRVDSMKKESGFLGELLQRADLTSRLGNLLSVD